MEKIEIKKKKKMNADRFLFLLSYFGWAIPLTALSFFGVKVGTLVMSFQKDVVGGGTIFTFDNYIRIFKQGFSADGLFVECLRNSLLFFALSMFIMMPINIIVGYFFSKKIAGYKTFRILFYLPNVLPGLIMATLFKYITAPDGAGVLASLFYSAGMNFPNLFGDSRYAIWSLLFYSLWSGFGAGFLLFGAAMKRIPPEVLESAQLDGVGWIREIVSIYIPLIWPFLAMTILTALPGIFQQSGAILFFTQGDYGTQTLSFWFFLQVKDRTNLNYVAATGLFFSIIAVPLMLISRWLLDKVPDVQY